MKRLLLLPAVLLSLFALVSAATAEEKAQNKPPEGFTALFNGKDLSGWKGLVGNPKSRAKMTPEELAKAQVAADKKMKDHWKAENGVIVFDGKGDSLCSAKDFADFELLVDWKIDANGDSGIYLRGMPQVQIWDPKDPSQQKHGCDKGSGALWNNAKNPKFPLVKADNPVGEWNTFRIKMVGDKVTIHLNDKLVTDNVTMEDYQDHDHSVPKTGQIELQNHSHPLYFRNIYIKELPAK
ncbi:MAG: 3-keto-disaccharide hydrolase [Pirellulaceae bacterium]